MRAFKNMWLLVCVCFSAVATFPLTVFKKNRVSTHLIAEDVNFHNLENKSIIISTTRPLLQQWKKKQKTLQTAAPNLPWKPVEQRREWSGTFPLIQTWNLLLLYWQVLTWTRPTSSVWPQLISSSVDLLSLCLPLCSWEVNSCCHQVAGLIPCFFFVWRLHVVLMCRCVSLPQSKDQFTLTIHSKFTTGVNVCVNGCRSLSVALCWWRTDQGVTPDRLDPMARWVRFQIPHQL